MRSLLAISLAICYLVEGRDVDPSMPWHAECVVRMMFRSIVSGRPALGERKTRGEVRRIEVSNGNRPTATMKRHLLVQVVVTGSDPGIRPSARQWH